MLIKNKQTNKQQQQQQTPGGTPYNGLYGEAPPERGKGFYSLKYTKG